MHQQIKASPDTIAENIRARRRRARHCRDQHRGDRAGLRPAARAGARPAQQVRRRRLTALEAASLEPTIVRAVEPVRMPNKPAALKTAMDALEGQGHVIESILVLAGRPGKQRAGVLRRRRRTAGRRELAGRVRRPAPVHRRRAPEPPVGARRERLKPGMGDGRIGIATPGQEGAGNARADQGVTG